jgi:hypothetical protein
VFVRGLDCNAIAVERVVTAVVFKRPPQQHGLVLSHEAADGTKTDRKSALGGYKRIKLGKKIL